MNVKKFFHKNYNHMDNYIPAYVNYLIENKEFDKLKRVLIADYFYYYPSQENNINHTFNKIYSRINFLEYCLVFLVTGVIGVLLCQLIPSIFIEIIGRIRGNSRTEVRIFNLNIPGFVLSVFLIVVLISSIVIILKLLERTSRKQEVYTYDEKIIRKIVESKEKQYDKLKERVYFL